MSHNVPAVDDVLPARIMALRSKGQGWQNVGGVGRGNEAKRNDLATRNPEPPTGGEAFTACYTTLPFSLIILSFTKISFLPYFLYKKLYHYCIIISSSLTVVYKNKFYYKVFIKRRI
jgi:hypothetical protein